MDVPPNFELDKVATLVSSNISTREQRADRRTLSA